MQTQEKSHCANSGSNGQIVTDQVPGMIVTKNAQADAIDRLCDAISGRGYRLYCECNTPALMETANDENPACAVHIDPTHNPEAFAVIVEAENREEVQN